MTDTNSNSEIAPTARAFRNLFLSTSVSSLGASVSAVSVNWVVYHYTLSSIDISYVGLAGIVPGVVLGLFAGVLADRHNRKTIMVISDLFRMALMASLALALFLFGFSLVIILAIMIAVNSFSSLFLPASQALVPRIVDRSSLEHANGVLQGTQAAMLSIGSAMGGVLVAFAGAVLGLGLNAITYLLSAVFLIQISGRLGKIAVSEDTGKPSIMEDLKVGMRYMKENRPVLEVTLGFLPSNFFGALVETFLVVYAASHFGQNAAVYGYLAAGVSIGIVIGSLAVGRIHARRFAGWVMGLNILVTAGAIYLLILSYSVVLSLAATIIAGLSIGLINTTYLSTMQAIVPDSTLARVLSVDSVGSFAAIPAGIAVGGVLAASYGVDFSFTIAAAGMLVNSIVVLSMKGFRTMGYAP